MKKIAALFSDGLALALPLGFVGYFLLKAYLIIKSSLHPLLVWLGLPDDSRRWVVIIASVLVLVAGILLLGLFMRLHVVGLFRNALEATLLRFFPFLNQVKAMVAGYLHRADGLPGWQPVLLHLSDKVVYAFLIEESASFGVFYITQSNNLQDGAVEIIPTSGYHYQMIDVQDMRRVLKQFGKGTLQLITNA